MLMGGKGGGVSLTSFTCASMMSPPERLDACVHGWAFFCHCLYRLRVTRILGLRPVKAQVNPEITNRTNPINNRPSKKTKPMANSHMRSNHFMRHPLGQ